LRSFYTAYPEHVRILGSSSNFDAVESTVLSFM